MKSHEIKLQIGRRKSYLGALCITDEKLYFICASQGSALLSKLSPGLGLVGGIMQVLSDMDGYGDKDTIDEEKLAQLVQENEGSIAFETSKITKIQHNWLLRLIKYDGKTIGILDGGTKALLDDLGAWCEKHGIPKKGF